MDFDVFAVTLRVGGIYLVESSLGEIDFYRGAGNAQAGDKKYERSEKRENFREGKDKHTESNQKQCQNKQPSRETP